MFRAYICNGTARSGPIPGRSSRSCSFRRGRGLLAGGFPRFPGGGGTATVATDGHTYLLAKCRRCFGRSEQQEQDEAGIYSCLARGVVSRSVSFLSLID